MYHKYIIVNSREHQERFRELVDWEFSEHSVPLLLAPGENVTVTVAFRAEETNRVSALLALRNNLTALELVTLQGHGVHPQFKFGNRRPGSEQPLSFDVTERHVKECEKGRNARTTDASGLMVRRSFTAKNVGDVAIYVNSFYINDYPCEGYGFKVCFGINLTNLVLTVMILFIYRCLIAPRSCCHRTALKRLT